MNYVIGFAFCGTKVALIRKSKPAWQAGRLNGVGGKIEGTETPSWAMYREFHEETGVFTSPTEWDLKFVMRGERGDWTAHVFAMEMDMYRFRLLRTTTEERIEKHVVNDLPYQNCISNLYWMIPMARDKSGVKLPITIPFAHADGTGS